MEQDYLLGIAMDPEIPKGMRLAAMKVKWKAKATASDYQRGSRMVLSSTMAMSWVKTLVEQKAI